MSGFFGWETDPCWHCGAPIAENFRYCPNCGLWLVNAEPIHYTRGRNIHSGDPFVFALDDRRPQHRVPSFAAVPSLGEHNNER